MPLELACRTRSTAGSPTTPRVTYFNDPRPQWLSVHRERAAVQRPGPLDQWAAGVCNPARIVLSDVRKSLPTNRGYLDVRVSSCRALGGTVGTSSGQCATHRCTAQSANRRTVCMYSANRCPAHSAMCPGLIRVLAPWLHFQPAAMPSWLLLLVICSKPRMLDTMTRQCSCTAFPHPEATDGAQTPHDSYT